MKLSSHLIKQFDIDQANGGAKFALEQIYAKLRAELEERTKKRHIRAFLSDQVQSNTKQALYNMVHLLCEDLLHDIGVRHIKTANKVFNKTGRSTARLGNVVDAEHGSFQNMQQD